MASHVAYVPWVSSPVARKRYTSPTTAIVRPSVGFLIIGDSVMLYFQSRRDYNSRVSRFTFRSWGEQAVSIRVSCPICGKTLEVNESLAGKTGKCPICEAPITIPHSNQVLPLTAAPASTVSNPSRKRITMRCPHCDDTKIKALSLVWGEGSSLSTGTNIGVGTLLGGLFSTYRRPWSAIGAGLSRSYRTHSTTLAKQCEPPRKKTLHWAVVAMIFGGLMVFGSIISLVDPDLARNSGSRHSDVGSSIAGFIAGPVVAFFGFAYFITAQQFNRDIYPNLLQSCD
jgi:endogenous inhibitor of DNA gyrase (YacG/DUF329 family)